MKKTTSKAVIQAAANYNKAHAEKKRAEQIEKEARAALLEALDAAGVDAMEAGAYLVTRGTSTRRALNQKRLKEERPEIVEAYTEPQTVTRFNVDK